MHFKIVHKATNRGIVIPNDSSKSRKNTQVAGEIKIAPLATNIKRGTATAPIFKFIIFALSLPFLQN